MIYSHSSLFGRRSAAEGGETTGVCVVGKAGRLFGRRGGCASRELGLSLPDEKGTNGPTLVEKGTHPKETRSKRMHTHTHTNENIYIKKRTKRKQHLFCLCTYAVFLFDSANETSYATWNERSLHRQREHGPNGCLSLRTTAFALSLSLSFSSDVSSKTLQQRKSRRTEKKSSPSGNLGVATSVLQKKKNDKQIRKKKKPPTHQPCLFQFGFFVRRPLPRLCLPQKFAA